MIKSLLALIRFILGSARDLLPIILVIGFFQIVVLQQSLPNLFDLFIGVMLVILGLAFFIYGLETGLFPLGESMAYAFARKGSLFWLTLFAFALGFGTTVAEPALIAIAGEAGRAAAATGEIPDTPKAQADYALGLRITVGLSVGSAIVLGVFRIIKGWPIHRLIMVGYVLVAAVTPFAPAEIIGIAYDSGGVTTSTITVPLVTALGVGLASSIRGRTALIDGFGLIAFASLLPMLFVMAYGMLR